MSPLRFGIVGTNFISEWFVKGCRRSNGRAVASAVLSRRRDTGEAFARANDVEMVFDDFDRMAEAVDAIYIASPNALHHPQALRAIGAGKHVLVEKVMGASLAEVTEIFQAAERRGVVAMEATRNLHSPAHRLVREALPRLGTIRQVRFAKQQYSSRYDRFRAGDIANAFDPSLGNSSLADIGVYVLQPALDLFGPPLTRTGASVILANGFEGAGSMTLGYPGLVVDLSWSKITTGLGPSVILGEDGGLTIDDLAEPSRIELHLRNEQRRILLDSPTVPSETLHHEILAFVGQVEAGAMDPRWSEVTWQSRQLMDAHLAAVATQA